MSLKAVLFALFISCLWGGNVVSIKIGLGGFPPLFMAGLRFLLGACAILLWIVVKQTPLKPEKGDLICHGISGVLFSLQISLFYLGTNLTSASLSSILIETKVFFVTLLSHFTIEGDRLSTEKAFGIICAFLGVAFLFAGRPVSPSPYPSMGKLLILASSFLLAIKTIYIKKLIETRDPAVVVFYQMVIGTPLLFLLSLLCDGRTSYILSGEIVLALLYQGVVVAGFCFVSSTILLKHYPPSSVSSFSLVIPLSGVFLSHLFLGEALTSHVLGGAALVAAGIGIINLRGMMGVGFEE